MLSLGMFGYGATHMKTSSTFLGEHIELRNPFSLEFRGHAMLPFDQQTNVMHAMMPGYSPQFCDFPTGTKSG